MAFIKKSRQLTSQPQDQVEVDWENPLNEGLVFLAAMVGASGFDDLVGDRAATASGTVGFAPTEDGTGAQFNGSSYLSYGSAVIVSDTTPITITLCEENDSPSLYAALAGFATSSNRWLWMRGSSALYYCSIGRYGSAWNFSTIGAPSSGERVRFVLTLPNGLASVSGARAWANGIELAGAATSYGGIATGNTIGWDGGDYKWNGRISDVSIRARIWDDDEVAAYFDRPAQVYRGRKIWVPVSASGGTAVNPGAGSVAISGYAPTVDRTAHVALVPDDGSVGITGHAPTVTQGSSRAVDPDAGVVSITGYAPDVARTAHQAVLPDVGVVTVTGYAPTVQQTSASSIIPSAGELAITGHAPSVGQSAHVALVTDVGALTITGYAPSVVQATGSPSLVPGVGSLTIEGHAPTVEQSAPAVAQETFYATPKKKRKYHYDFSTATSPMAVALSKAIEVKAKAVGAPREEIERTLRKVTDLGEQTESVARQIEAEAREIETERKALAVETQRLQDAEDAEVAEILAMLL